MIYLWWNVWSWVIGCVHAWMIRFVSDDLVLLLSHNKYIQMNFSSLIHVQSVWMEMVNLSDQIWVQSYVRLLWHKTHMPWNILSFLNSIFFSVQQIVCIHAPKIASPFHYEPAVFLQYILCSISVLNLLTICANKNPCAHHIPTLQKRSHAMHIKISNHRFRVTICTKQWTTIYYMSSGSRENKLRFNNLSLLLTLWVVCKPKPAFLERCLNYTVSDLSVRSKSCKMCLTVPTFLALCLDQRQSRHNFHVKTKGSSTIQIFIFLLAWCSLTKMVLKTWQKPHTNPLSAPCWTFSSGAYPPCTSSHNSTEEGKLFFSNIYIQCHFLHNFQPKCKGNVNWLWMAWVITLEVRHFKSKKKTTNKQKTPANHFLLIHWFFCQIATYRDTTVCKLDKLYRPL